MDKKLDRRDFLRFTGGGAVGLATAGVTVKGISSLNAALAAEEVPVPRGPESWALSVCSLCPAGCGLRVRKIGDRAVRIQGNPLHPVNHTGLCPRGLAGLQVLYHPHRLRAPLENVGTRENPDWKELPWQEAIEKVAARLLELRDKQHPESFLFISGRAGHLRNHLFRRFAESFGSPNFLQAPSGLEAAQQAAFLQQGTSEGLAYDLEEARYILSFGANLLEGWGSPVSAMRAFGHWRDTGSGRRNKFAQIEPRFSPTAAKADEWVALKPGTEAALALGIAYVLITEGLFDADFLADHAFGFEDWTDRRGRTHMGFRSMVLRDYRLNAVSALTEVPVETILRLAREFGRNRPALALPGQTSSTLPGDVYTAMAVHSLNALVGSIERPGGMLTRTTLPGEEPARRGLPPALLAREELPSGMADLSQLSEALSAGLPYPAEVVFIHGTDPVFTLPEGNRLAEALKKVPFVVSFSSFMDETSALADIILPDHTDLERWQEAASPATFPVPLQSLAAPVVEPVHDTRDSGEVILSLAQALGGEVASAFRHESVEDHYRSETEKIFALHTGYTFAPHLEETWNRMLERSGWWAPTFSNQGELWDEMQATGGWWEPTYFHGEWDRVFQSPSRRFEFYSQRLAQFAAAHRDQVRAQGFDDDEGEDRYCLPHQPARPSPPAEFPLLLMPVEVLPLMGSHGAHLPYLQQIAGQHVFEHWQSWLEMNPETAHELGLHDLDQVWVESQRERVQVRLRTHPGIRPGVVHLPLGYGQTRGSEWACRGVNPLHLVETTREPLAGLPQTTQTFVRVYRV